MVNATKRCPGCRLEKSVDDFAVNRTKKSGRQDYCRSCLPEMNRAWRLKNHGLSRLINNQSDKRRIEETTAKVNAFKAARGCADCRVSSPPYILDLDHRRGDKEGHIGTLVRSRSWDRLQEELAKCDVVCANCHRVRSFIDRGRTRPYTTTELHVQALKTSPCHDCGRSFHFSAMDFDHIIGEKTATISDLVRREYSLVHVLAEIEKCELVCANCHRVRTHLRLVATRIESVQIQLIELENAAGDVLD